MVTVLRNEGLYTRDSRGWSLLRDGTVDPGRGVGGVLAPRDGIYYVDLTSMILNHPSAPTDLDAQSAVSATLILGSQFEVAWITQALRLRLTDPRFDERSGGRLSAGDCDRPGHRR